MDYADEFNALLAEWAIQAESIELVSQSENSVFKVVSANKDVYALRVHREGYHSLAELNAEQAWTQALNEFGVRTPHVYKTKDDDYYKPSYWQGKKRYAGLIEWIEADSLATMIKVNQEPTILYEKIAQIGELCGQMHTQALGWKPPVGFKRHRLDVDGFFGEAPCWGRFWEAPALTTAQCKLFTLARAKLRQLLDEYAQSDVAFSVIHADMHSNNLLVVDDELVVIDFDDTAYGWHLYDIATALTKYRGRNDFAQIKQAFMNGYRQYKGLRDVDMVFLPYFYLTRTLATIGWTSARPELAGYEGILAHLVNTATDHITSLGWK